jgi:hypothetical protein
MAKSSGAASSVSLVGLIGLIVAAAAAALAGGGAYLLTRPPEPRTLLVDSPALQRVQAAFSEDPFTAVDRFERHEMDLLQFNHDAAALISSDSDTRAKQPGTIPRNQAAPAPFERYRFGLSEAQFSDALSSLAPLDKVKSVLPVMVTNSNVPGSAESRRRTRYAVVSALGELGYVPSDNKHIGYVIAHLPGDVAVRIPFEAFERSTASARKPEGAPSTVTVLWVDAGALNVASPALQRNWLGRLVVVLRNLGVCPPAPDACHANVIGPSNSGQYLALQESPGTDIPVGGLPRIVSPFVTSSVLYASTVRQQVQALGLQILRAIPTDADGMHAMVGELLDRNVKLCDTHNAVLMLGEWDTEYGRRASWLLKSAMDNTGRCQDRRHAETLFYSFIGGIDGAPPAVGTTDSDAASTDASATTSSSPPPIEWPETADQRDYIRRLGANLMTLPIGKRIVAVGIVASDAHDKLLLLQALRDSMPRTPFFTLDVDARLAHPLVRQWARNLLIASGFGLTLRRELQGQTPPFRDTYQTSTFLATLMALQPPSASGQAQTIATPDESQLFEVGRTQLVPLLGGATRSIKDSGCDPWHLSSCNTVQPIYEAPAWGRRIWIDLFILVVAGSAAMLVWALRSPGRGMLLRQPGSGLRLFSYARSKTAVASLLGFIASVATFTYFAHGALISTPSLRPPEPLLLTEGVSSWPVLFIWLLALCLTFMFLLRIAVTLQPRLDAIQAKYLGVVGPAKKTSARIDYLSWLIELFGNASSTDSKLGAEPFAVVWARYEHNARGWRRLLRIFFIWLIVFVVPFVLVYGASLAPPHVVRGTLGDVARGLDRAIFAMLTVLMAAVADAVLLCTLFVIDLGRRRHQYEDGVLTARQKQLNLDPTLRSDLDVIIDIELIGNRTASVAEYLYYPFVVLSVLALSMTQLFDDWVFSWNRAGLYAYYAAVIGLLWLALHTSAVHARDKAVSELQLSWVRMQNPSTKGGATDAARSQFKLLRKRIQNTTAGAYGSLLGQPIFKAILLPLGSLSTAQLAQFFLQR